MKIVEGGLDHPDVIDMLRFHFDTNVSVTPPGSVHVFDLSRLNSPTIHFYSAWIGETLMGVGALRMLGDGIGEIKSMHTLKTSRRSGVGGAMLRHILDEAQKYKLKRLYLETGSFAFFAPARALYAKQGFTECGPYGDYKPDPNSTFMTKEI